MAAKYKPGVLHALLSAKGRALSADDLETHAVLAEELLGLTDTDYTGAQAVSATIAVARQISYQIILPGDIGFLQSQSRGGRSESYRSGGNSGVAILDPFAARIVAALKRIPYTAHPSVRGRRSDSGFSVSEELARQIKDA